MKPGRRDPGGRRQAGHPPEARRRRTGDPRPARHGRLADHPAPRQRRRPRRSRSPGPRSASPACGPRSRRHRVRAPGRLRLDLGRRGPRRLRGRARSTARTATSSTCATTAAACSTPRSTSPACSSRKGPIVSTIDRAGDRDVRSATGKTIDAKPLVAAGQQVHRERFGDHRRRGPGLQRRHARRHQDVRQGRRAESLHHARPRRAQDHDRALRHPQGPRHPPQGHRPRRRSCRSSSRARAHRSWTPPPTSSSRPPRRSSRARRTSDETVFPRRAGRGCSRSPPRASPPRRAAAPRCRAPQSEELVTSYAHLVEDFYKKVDRQAALTARTTRCWPISRPTRSPTRRCRRSRRPTTTRPTCARSSARSTPRSRATARGSSRSTRSAPATQLTYAAISGVLGSVKDRYTTFLTPKQFADLNEGLDGTSFGGVGISYSLDEKTHDAARRERHPRRAVREGRPAARGHDRRDRRQADRPAPGRRDGARGAAEARHQGAARRTRAPRSR